MPTLARIATSAVPSGNGRSSASSTRPASAIASPSLVEVLGEDHELVTAETRDGVAVAHQLGEALGDGQQQAVADVVSEVVVDGLELVEVDEQHRHHAVAAMPVQSRERLAGAVHQQQAVG